MPAWAVPLIAAGVTALGSVFSAKAASKEAEKNRQFQERMSSTAIQREVEDARRSGLNPGALRIGGASTPAGSVASMPDLGEAAGRAVGSALAVKQAQASIELTKAETQRAYATANEANQRAEDLFSSRPGRLALTEAQVLVQQATATERQQLLPSLLAKAKEEVGFTASSARAAAARAMLDEFAKSGAANVSKFEEKIGEAGPWARLLFELLRATK